jgi:hypothetical protein
MLYYYQHTCRQTKNIEAKGDCMPIPQSNTVTQVELLIRNLQTSIEKRIDAIQGDTTSLRRAIQGQNGEIGIIARLVILEKRFEEFSKSIENATTQFDKTSSEFVACRFDHTRQMDEIRSAVKRGKEDVDRQEKEREKRESEFGAWKWFRDNWLQALLYAVVASIVLGSGQLLVKAVIQAILPVELP